MHVSGNRNSTREAKGRGQPFSWEHYPDRLKVPQVSRASDAEGSETGVSSGSKQLRIQSANKP